MALSNYNLEVEGDHIRVRKVESGRSKKILVSSPQAILDRIGCSVQARSHLEVLEWISEAEADEVAQDIAISEFAEWGRSSKKAIAESCECGVLPKPHVLQAWMKCKEIGEFSRRRIVWYLLARRATSVEEWNQLIVDFKDVFPHHKRLFRSGGD